MKKIRNINKTSNKVLISYTSESLKKKIKKIEKENNDTSKQTFS